MTHIIIYPQNISQTIFCDSIILVIDHEIKNFLRLRYSVYM